MDTNKSFHRGNNNILHTCAMYILKSKNGGMNERAKVVTSEVECKMCGYTDNNIYVYIAINCEKINRIIKWR